MKTFYAVKKGRSIGIFMSEKECTESVDGYHGAKYKEFSTEAAARSYLGMPGVPTDEKKNERRPAFGVYNTDPDARLVVYTDGSCDGRRYGWGMVVIEDAHSARGYCGFGSRPGYVRCGSLAGELIAALKAMEYAIDHGYRHLVICHDFTGVRQWAAFEHNPKNRVAQSYQDMVENMRSYGLEISFRKVKAHSGVWGNAIADGLAGRGMRGESLPTSGAGLHLDREVPIDTVRPNTPPASSTVQGPIALLLDDNTEKACVAAIQSMAALLDSMYGNDCSSPVSLSGRINEALAAAVPGILQTEQQEGETSSNELPAQDDNPMCISTDEQTAEYASEPPHTDNNEKEDIADRAIDIGATLYKARRRADLSVSQISAACGISRRDLLLIERGMMDDADQSIVRRIASELQCHEILDILPESDEELGNWAAEMCEDPAQDDQSDGFMSFSEAVGEQKSESTGIQETASGLEPNELKSNTEIDERLRVKDREESSHASEICAGKESNEDLIASVASVIHEARRAAGLRRMDLAAACGMSVRTLSRLECGAFGTDDTDLVQIVTVKLGCSDNPEVMRFLETETSALCEERLAGEPSRSEPAPPPEVSRYSADQYNELTRHITALLREARQTLGIPIHEVAEACGISSYALEMLESSAIGPVSADTMRHIAEVVGHGSLEELDILADMEASIWPPDDESVF